MIDAVDRANKGAGGCLWAGVHFDTLVGNAPLESSHLQVRASDGMTAVAGAAELQHSMPVQGRHDCFVAYRAHCHAVAPTTTTMTLRSRSKQYPNAADVLVVVVVVVVVAKTLR